VTEELRARLYDAQAQGPVAELLRALAPALSAVFGSELEHREQVNSMTAPALAARVREARELVGLPALDAYMDPELGRQVVLEPGAPDRVSLGLPALAELEPGALMFLLVRASESSLAGCAVARLAGVDGLEGLLRCALAATGASVSVPEPFDAMVEAVAEAVRARAQPADLAALATRAAEALAADNPPTPAGLLEALERSVARVALVACGEPGAAVRALLCEEAPAWSLGLTAAAQRVPLVEELVRTCLRDDWGALRAACADGSAP